MWWLGLLGCGPPDLVELGAFTIDLHDDGTLDLLGPEGGRLEGFAVLAGTGEATVEMGFGSFRVTDAHDDLIRAAGIGDVRGGRDGLPLLLTVVDEADVPLADLVLSASGRTLLIDVIPTADHDRVGFAAACDADDHFMGLGGHQQDVDHVGHAFDLWTSEPGIGKSTTDDEPPAGSLEGARHDTSYPVPFVLRPHHPDGLLVDTAARLEVDLCATDPAAWQVVAWDDGPLSLVWFDEASPADTVRALTGHTGRPTLPQPWVFGPWADAIRGPERVREVRDALLAEGAPTTVIWSEDWQGAREDFSGYRLNGEWFVDRSLYPDVEELADELEDVGIKWFAYFAPFLDEGDETFDAAIEAGVLVKNEAGEPYLFPGVNFKDAGLIDVSTEGGRSFAADYMVDCLDLGFDGWMADYGEWLPADAVLANGARGVDAHNQYPEWWQQTVSQAQEGYDATFFVRSGWTRTGGQVPVVWGGDQRTSFDTDDGFPTVVSLGVGLGASGVPVFTHDVAGYQTLGNGPSDQELWFRWASLGAYSPIFRLHHGIDDQANWQFDRDEETAAHHAAVTRENMRLWPYRYGLAARAADEGTPMVQPVAFVHGGADWGRQDAWMLGDSLLVAPVLEAGVDGREVELPSGVRWWRWPSLLPAGSGYHEAPLGEIPVFAAEGTTVPTFDTIPQTLVEGASVTTLSDVDDRRVVYLFGGGGPFEEGDGTVYWPSGSPSGPGEATATFAEGSIEVSGVTVQIDGPVERTYRVIVTD